MSFIWRKIFLVSCYFQAHTIKKRKRERERERERTKHRLQKNFKPYIKEIFIYAPFLQTARIGKILCSRYSCIERMSIGNWVCACMCTCLPEIYTKPYIRVIMLITLDRSVLKCTCLKNYFELFYLCILLNFGRSSCNAWNIHKENKMIYFGVKLNHFHL